MRVGIKSWVLSATVALPAIGAQPEFDPSLVGQAVAEKPVRWFLSPTVNTEYTKYWVLHTGKAMNYMALVVHRDPDARTADGTPVIDPLLQQIRHMIAGGNEPLCRGTIAGWADNSAAQTLALAKATSAVWKRLTDDERNRCTWLMKALTVAGNYCQNHDADVHRCLFQTYNWRKQWNPNHQEGYVGVMIASWFYFGGAKQVNEILASFDYDEWTAALSDLGFTNITGCWQATGKERMEHGGRDDHGGTIVSVRTPFTYRDVWGGDRRVAYEPFALYEVLVSRMYDHVCRDRIGDKGRIADGASPWVGQFGMLHEFDSGDGYGLRTDARYAYDGWCNNVLTCATLVALGGFDPSPESSKMAARVVVGSEDLIYKLERGYHGWANGKEKHCTEKSVAKLGYFYVKDVWRKVVLPEMREHVPTQD